MCSLKSRSSAAQLETSRVGTAFPAEFAFPAELPIAEWQTRAGEVGRDSLRGVVCVCACVTDVAKLPRHPELLNVSPVAKHYLHICTTMDVLENAVPGSLDFTTWLSRLLTNLLLLKPGDHQKQCSCLTSLGPILHILEPLWEWIHAATSTSKGSMDMFPISLRLLPKRHASHDQRFDSAIGTRAGKKLKIITATCQRGNCSFMPSHLLGLITDTGHSMNRGGLSNGWG